MTDLRLTFLGVLRDDGALSARLLRQAVAPEFESREVAARAAEAGAWWEIIECPLADLPPCLLPPKAPLLVAWEALGAIVGPTAEADAALRLVLAETVLGRPAPGPSVPFKQETVGRRPMPTAAHPRAYRGTKRKPPQERSPAPADLRSALCGTGRCALLSDTEAARVADEARLPESFRTSLYLLVRRQSSAVSEALGLYWALGLDRDVVRLAAAAALFSACPSPRAAQWCRLAAALPEEHRTVLLHLVLASGAHTAAPPPLLAERLEEVLSGSDPVYRTYWLLRGLLTAIAPDYLVVGYRLADAHWADYPFHEVTRSGHFPARAVDALQQHLVPAQGSHASYALTLWRQCGEREGLGELIESVSWTQYPPEIAYHYRCLFSDYSWDELTLAQTTRKWPVVRGQQAAVEALLQEVPEDYRRKCLLHLEEYFWQWDAPGELAALLPGAFALTRRLCRPPFGTASDPSEVLTDFLAEPPAPLRARFLAAPDASFRRLEEACRRENDTRRIGRGTYTLSRTLPFFSVRCFEAYPALLLKVAKLLGCLSGPARLAVVAPFRTSPLFGEELAALPPADAARLVEAHRDPLAFHPVPLKLREHLAGTRTMAPDALARAVELMATQALRTALEMLEAVALRTLAEGYAVEPGREPVRHALQMERMAGDNRRALRRLLRAHWEGRPRYIQDHPRTRRWLVAHPRLNLALWLQGVQTEGDAGGLGRVTLTTERDTLEVLKMGTFVGSCLGLGGAFTHSAAAVALDINKQVVYARDARGVVVARQLVALAEDDRLVCFSVYPLGVSPALEALFAAHDRRLSQALGLPLHDASGDEDYEIAHILSHSWWDDMAWDLTAGDGEERQSAGSGTMAA